MSILPIWFIYVATLLRLSGGAAYIRATIRGEAKPNPVSWLLWSLTPLISFFAGLSDGFDALLIVTFATGISPLLVFFIAITRNPRSLQFDTLNVSCFIIAVAGIGLWTITDHPLLAIALAIAADIVSALPTLAKLIRHPYSEYAPTYMLSAISMMLALLAAETLSPLATVFPIYVLLMNLAIVGLIISVRARRRLQIKRGIARSRRKSHQI